MDTIYHIWDIHLIVQYKHSKRLLYETTLTNIYTTNLKNVQDQQLTIHGLSDDEIEFVTHDSNKLNFVIYVCVYI